MAATKATGRFTELLVHLSGADHDVASEALAAVRAEHDYDDPNLLVAAALVHLRDRRSVAVAAGSATY